MQQNLFLCILCIFTAFCDDFFKLSFSLFYASVVNFVPCYSEFLKIFYANVSRVSLRFAAFSLHQTENCDLLAKYIQCCSISYKVYSYFTRLSFDFLGICEFYF